MRSARVFEFCVNTGVRVTLSLRVYSAPSATVFEPSVHPVRVYPSLYTVKLPGIVIAVPSSAVMAAGATPQSASLPRENVAVLLSTREPGSTASTAM